MEHPLTERYAPFSVSKRGQDQADPFRPVVILLIQRPLHSSQRPFVKFGVEANITMRPVIRVRPLLRRNKTATEQSAFAQIGRELATRKRLLVAGRRNTTSTYLAKHY